MFGPLHERGRRGGVRQNVMLVCAVNNVPGPDLPVAVRLGVLRGRAQRRRPGRSWLQPAAAGRVRRPRHRRRGGLDRRRVDRRDRQQLRRAAHRRAWRRSSGHGTRAHAVPGQGGPARRSATNAVRTGTPGPSVRASPRSGGAASDLVVGASTVRPPARAWPSTSSSAPSRVRPPASWPSTSSSASSSGASPRAAWPSTSSSRHRPGASARRGRGPRRRRRTVQGVRRRWRGPRRRRGRGRQVRPPARAGGPRRRVVGTVEARWPGCGRALDVLGRPRCSSRPAVALDVLVGLDVLPASR